MPSGPEKGPISKKRFQSCGSVKQPQELQLGMGLRMRKGSETPRSLHAFPKDVKMEEKSGPAPRPDPKPESLQGTTNILCVSTSQWGDKLQQRNLQQSHQAPPVGGRGLEGLSQFGHHGLLPNQTSLWEMRTWVRQAPLTLPRHPQSRQIANWRRLSQTG